MLVNTIIFILGLIVGSFLNVCIYRLPREKSIVFPGSSCPNCSNKIKFYDNIPIISYLLLRGKCRFCKAPISARYPIVELSTAILFVLINTLLVIGIWSLVIYSIFVSCMVIAFFSDLETQIIPDSASYIAIAAGLIYNYSNNNLFFSIWGLVLGFLILWGIGYFGKLYYKKDVMGGGDIKLAMAFGAFFGWQGLVLSLFTGYIIGAVSSIVLIATKKKTLSDYIPFGPSLVSGALITLFWGKIIINYYVANFL